MEFLDFLKYGAMGISLALAILSFRLLSKEQEKETERPAFLKSIKNYMWLTVFLSVFFGFLEIVSQFTHNEKNSNSYLDTIWNVHFKQYNDSTPAQKAKRISDYIKNPVTEIDTQITCKQYQAELEQCKSQLAAFDEGFYQSIIKLKKNLQTTPDGWVNLRFETASKTEILNILRTIFVSLGSDSSNYTNKEIIDEWELLKSNWTDNRLGYIFNSDITELIKVYLKTYEDN
jgi:hypothetical protein